MLIQDRVFDEVTKYYNVTKELIISPARYQKIVNIRFITIYLLRKYSLLSLPQIGRLLNRDHTSILNEIGRAHV